MNLKSGIVNKAIDPTRILNSVMREDAGGTVMFIGTIRDATNGKEVKGLEYEVYRRMAERRLSELENEIKERWPIKSIRIVHREGKLNVGDVSVVVAVSAAHRREAFEAARFSIERLKRSFPIWKRESLASGQKTWARGTPIQSGFHARGASRSGRPGNVRRHRRTLVEAGRKPHRPIAAP